MLKLVVRPFIVFDKSRVAESVLQCCDKKSRIRETLNLSTNADRDTITIYFYFFLIFFFGGGGGGFIFFLWGF